MPKRLVRLFASLAIAPLLLSYWLLARLSGADAALEPHSQLLALAPGKLGSYLRVAFYRHVLQRCEPTATIAFGVLFSKSQASLGQNVYIGPYCQLGWVTIEDDVLLGPLVQIPSGPTIHGIDRLDVPIRDQPGRPRRVTIGRDSWIGGGSVILADVSEQTVVGAGSVVTKPHPPQTMIAGVPARVVRTR